MGGLGAMTASLPLDAALGHFDWRQIFVGLSGAVVVLSLLFAIWVPEHASQARPAPLARQLTGLGRILHDGAFRRIAFALGASQAALLSLFTLWMTAWLRDVAGFDRAASARALAWVSAALILGYFFFGRLADAFARRGRSPLPLFAGGVAGALTMLALLALGVTSGAVLLWSAFVFFGTGATVANSIATRRYPREMAGRVNTMLNTFTFTGTFLGQWAMGAVLNHFPPTAAGYDPRGYAYALWALWLVQAAGLVWLWSGRRLVYAVK
jgi:predicted MFS family arabinose efflux permease